MDTRAVARGVRAALTLLVGFAFDLTAQTVPPPCDLCTTTVIAWESTRDGNSEIYVAAPDGTGLLRLTNHPASDEAPVISPDGRRIAFDSDRSGALGLYVMNADGSNVVRVPAGVEHAFGPAWSPDGTMLAFTGYAAGNFDVYVTRLDGTGLRRLTTSPADDGAPSWSPDGTLIAFHSDRRGDHEIYTVNLLTLEERRLTTHPAIDALPAWSPDGRSIAFASTRAGDFEWDIYVMNADGSGVTQVTSGADVDSAPSWSPDGSQIAFERFPGVTTHAPDIYRIRRDGTGLARVTKSGTDRGPNWGAAVIAGVNVKAASATVQLRYRDRHWLADAPLSATGALHWIEGDLMRGSDFVALDLGRMGDSNLIDGLVPKRYELRLSYGPQQAGSYGQQRVVELMPRTPVDIVADTTTTVVVDVSPDMGVIKGAVTVNGTAPGEGLSLCVERRGDYHWCIDLPASGQFSVLLPRREGSGAVCSTELVTATQGCRESSRSLPGQLLRTFTYRVEERTTTVLPTIEFKAPLAKVELRYKDRSASELAPLSATGALHWIEGDLMRGDFVALDLGRMDDSNLIEGLAPKNYDLRLSYGPRVVGSYAQQRVVEFMPRTPVPIVADTTTTVVVDVSRSMGVIKGAVTVNGTAPGEGLSLCVERRGDYHWCTDLPASGQFSVLLPRREGSGAVCSTELVSPSRGCRELSRSLPGQLLRTFTYRVEEQATTLLPTIAFKAPLAQVDLRYQDRTWREPAPLSATGAMHWIEGDVMRSGTDLVALDLGRMGDSNLVEGLAPRNYDLRLLYGPQPTGRVDRRVFEIARRETVRIVADTTTTVTVDVSPVMGVIKGAVAFNGAAPGTGLSLCVERRGEYQWCTDLPANGQFSVLLPRGAGNGEICSMELVRPTRGCEAPTRPPLKGEAPPVLLGFDYTVEQGTTKDVTPRIRPQ